MDAKANIFRLFDADYYKDMITVKNAKGEDKTYPLFYLQIAFGRSLKNKTKIWTPVVNIIMSSDSSGQLFKLLNGLYTKKMVEKLLGHISKQFKSNVERDEAHKSVAKLIIADLKRNQYHVYMLLTECYTQSGASYNQISTIKRSDYCYDKDTILVWPKNYTRGQKPVKKMSFDLSSLDTKTEKTEVESIIKETAPLSQKEKDDYETEEKRKEEEFFKTEEGQNYLRLQKELNDVMCDSEVEAEAEAS
jgi:hypothetical protein